VGLGLGGGRDRLQRYRQQVCVGPYHLLETGLLGRRALLVRDGAHVGDGVQLAHLVRRAANRAEQEGGRTVLPEVGEEGLCTLPWRVFLDGGRVLYDELRGSSEPLLLRGGQQGGASGGESEDLPA
jgi:hypothetical protein